MASAAAQGRTADSPRGHRIPAVEITAGARKGIYSGRVGDTHASVVPEQWLKEASPHFSTGFLENGVFVSC